MSAYSNDDLREMAESGEYLTLVEVLATELLAARARIAELEAAVLRQTKETDEVLAERDALRAKLAEFEPREIRVGDEMASLEVGRHTWRFTKDAALGYYNEHADKFSRVVRIPIVPAPAAPQEHKPGCMCPTCGAQEPAKAPEPEADGDAGQLRFIVGLGAESKPVTLQHLSGCMSRHRTDLRRRMAVEIAERRLAEMPTLPPEPKDPLTPAGREYAKRTGLEGMYPRDPWGWPWDTVCLVDRIDKLEKRLAQHLEAQGKTL